MTLDQIETALLACASGTVFTLPDTLFGSGTLKTVFDHSLPDGQLVIDGALGETATAVTIAGQGQGVFAGMTVAATFTPQGDDVLLVATGTSGGGWSFGGAFPSLAAGVLGDLAVPAGATLTLCTIADSSIAAGLGFQGEVTVGGPLAQAAQFVGGLPSLPFAGPITFGYGAPNFALTAPVASKFTLGPLSDLGITMTLNAVPVPAADPSSAVHGANGAIVASTAVSVTINGQPANLPASVGFGGGALVMLQIGARSGAGVTIADLAQYALGGDLGALMPPPTVYDLASAIQLDTIDFSIAPLTPALVSVTFNLSATANWSIGSKFTVADVTASLYVPTASGSAINGVIAGALQIGDDGAICTLDAIATLPEGRFTAALDPTGAKPNIADLITYVAGDYGLPTISVEMLQIALDPVTADYSLVASFASDWALAIGDFGLAVTSAAITLDYANGTPSGAVGGTLVLDQDNRFDLSYAVPGGFELFAQVPTLSLAALVGALCKAVGAAPPGFDFAFTDSTILITEDTGAFAFKFGTQLDAYGSASVVVARGGAGWGFAFGLLLDTARLAALPGLGLLSLFDDAFALEEVVVVFGTLAESTFAFPALSDFDNPSIKAPKVASSGWNGALVPGLNIYAMMDPSKSDALGWLCKIIGFDGQIAASLQVPEDPVTGTSFAATLGGAVNGNMTLNGAFVAKLVGGNLVLGLTGTIPTTISGHPVTFTIEVDFEADGVFISGSTPDTIDFDGVQLGALAIEIGVDAEGIPSLGFAATIMAAGFDSSIAVFLNSADPAQSLFSGSIADVTLDQVLGPIIGLTAGSVPDDVTALLKQISLRGTDSFTLPASAVAALDARDRAALVAAFGVAGITLDADPRYISVLGGSADGAWAVTDLSTLTHYHLTIAADGSVAGEKEAQVAFVPQTTQIGALPPVATEYALSGALDVFGLTGIVDIDIAPSTGLSIAASLSPVHFLNDTLLTITDAADDGKGAYLSVCSYQQGSVPPHATASGKVTLLGLVGASVDIDISSSGATFALASTNPVYGYAIATTLNGSGFTATGTASLGFDRSVDLGVLGTVPLDVTIGGTITVSLSGTAASAGFSGGFTFEGANFSTGQVSLDVTAASLANLADALVTAVGDAISQYLRADLDPSQWLDWVENGVIPGMAADAQQVGQALGAAFHRSADQIAAATHDVLGYTADAAAVALQAANVTANAAATALAGAGYAADQIAAALKSVFDTHADTAVHVDTPSGPHIDTSPHVDTPAGPHGDTQVPPHGDAAPHIDTPSGPHADIGGGHVDSHQDVWGVGPHEDTSAPHIDDAVPPHGDTAPHVDTPGGPHVDGPVPPHGDAVSPHTDSAIPPHGDTVPHIDVQG